jgi:hypothetical protein
MGSVTNHDRRRALEALFVWCFAELKGIEPDNSTLEKLDFGSVEAMRIQLGIWEVPDWVTQGEPATEKPKAPKPPPRERKARSLGPALELPPASNAIPLFQERLELLMRAAEELKHRKEKRHDKLFTQSALYTNANVIVRELFSDEQWKGLAEHYGFDPDADLYSTSDVLTWNLGGGAPAPESPLPELIGAYLLAGGELEPLIEALHPDPDSAERPKIKKRIEGRKRDDDLDGLKTLARQLATAIRGGTLRTGSPGAELSRHEINVASRITELREQGWSNEDIYQKLCSSERFAQVLESWENFQRLADLEARYPFR